MVLAELVALTSKPPEGAGVPLLLLLPLLLRRRSMLGSGCGGSVVALGVSAIDTNTVLASVLDTDAVIERVAEAVGVAEIDAPVEIEAVGVSDDVCENDGDIVCDSVIDSVCVAVSELDADGGSVPEDDAESDSELVRVPVDSAD